LIIHISVGSGIDFLFKKANPVLIANLGNAYSNDQLSYVAIPLLSAVAY
jgi:hypothetical protein